MHFRSHVIPEDTQFITSCLYWGNDDSCLAHKTTPHSTLIAFLQPEEQIRTHSRARIFRYHHEHHQLRRIKFTWYSNKKKTQSSYVLKSYAPEEIRNKTPTENSGCVIKTSLFTWCAASHAFNKTICIHQITWHPLQYRGPHWLFVILSRTAEKNVVHSTRNRISVT